MSTDFGKPSGSDKDQYETLFPEERNFTNVAFAESSSLGTSPAVPLCFDTYPCDNVDDTLPNNSGSQLRSRRLSDSTAASSLSSDNRSLPLRYMSATSDNLGFDNRTVPKLSQSNPDIFSYHNQQDPSMTVQFTFGGGALMRQVSETSDGGSGHESRQSNGGNTASGNWGWFEDVHEQDGQDSGSGDKKPGNVGEKKKSTLLHFGAPFAASWNEFAPTNKASRTSIGAVTAPTYVLEESLSSQNLWKDTAGTRPPQPVEERAFFERIWTQNFARSQVLYAQPVEVLTATSPISLSPFADGNMVDGMSRGMRQTNAYSIEPSVDEATDDALVDSASTVQQYRVSGRTNLGPYHHHHTFVNKKVKGESQEELTVLVRGDNVFGTTVSKSFLKNGKAVTVSISIASYRVVESKFHGKYAQFLVIYCEGNFRDTVGVWKRYRDFEQLSRKVTHVPENCSNVLAGSNPISTSDDHEILPNAMTSWRLLKKRQRWYRCLDAGYLSLKVFLLERFLHDILFESSNPDILRDFVGVWSNRTKSSSSRGLSM